MEIKCKVNGSKLRPRFFILFTPIGSENNVKTYYSDVLSSLSSPTSAQVASEPS